MLRIFITGDNHIGLKYLSHEKASFLAAARLEALKGMAERANMENCGLFVITGDLFENNYGVPQRDIRAAIDALSAFKGTVALLPGNHDYYDRDSKLWQHLEKECGEKDNILLLTQSRPYNITVGDEDVTLYPAPCLSLHSEIGQNNLGWIKNENIPQPGCYRIGVAHGALYGQTIDSEGQYFLMTRQELENIPLDAWLLGNTHVPFPQDLREEFSECENILNPGTHVQTDVNCRTEGLCFIVEIGPDKKVRAKKVKTGTVRFFRLELKLSPGMAEKAVKEALAPLPDRSSVELMLSGPVTPEEYERLDAAAQGLLSRFIEGKCVRTDVSRLVSQELIDSFYPETSFASAFLKSLLDDPAEAQMAFDLLQTLKEDR